jgi:hypothetical protein
MPRKKAYLRFYEELNNFLPADKRKKTIEHFFYTSCSVKDAIESYGIPHTEVDLIIKNGEPIEFSTILKDQDRIAIYPKFESFDISSLNKLRPDPLRLIKFILDVHLGKLTRYLRLCGFDSVYENNFEDSTIIYVAQKEKRIILTRDKGILKNSRVTHGYWLRSDNPEEQMKEVIQRFDLKKEIKLFSRCTVCNGKLEKVNKNSIIEKLLPDTKSYYNEFYQCNQCGKIYWKGSHYYNMLKRIQEILDTI